MDLTAFLNDFLQTDSMDRLTSDAAALFDCPVMVVDDSFHTVSWHMSAGFRDKPFQGSVDRGELTYEASSLLSSSASLAQQGELYVELADSPWQRRFAPLIASGIRVGYLVLVDVHGTLRQVERRDFTVVESVLAKQLFLESSRSGLIFNTAEEVLVHLLENKFSTEAMFLLQASSTWLADFRPERIALINLGLYHNLHLAEDALKNELTYAFYASHPFLYNDEVLLFLNRDHDLSALEPLVGQYHLRVVISDPLDSLYALPQVYAATHEVMDFLLSRSSHPFCVRAEHLRALMMLRRLQDRADLIAPEVCTLARHDAAEHTQHCQTLLEYLLCHHSLQDTCRRLYTHRNTVLYRIRRMKEDFGIPLDDPDRQLELLLSVSLELLAQHQENLFVRGLTLEAPGTMPRRLADSLSASVSPPRT